MWFKMCFILVFAPPSCVESFMSEFNDTHAHATQHHQLLSLHIEVHSKWIVIDAMIMAAVNVSGKQGTSGSGGSKITQVIATPGQGQLVLFNG